jgi:hypothetical protein
MKSSSVLLGITLLIAGTIVVLAALTTFAKAWRGLEERRRSRLTEKLRPQLLTAIHDPSADAALEIQPRHIRSAMSLVRTLLSSLRGEDRERLVGVLERHGVLDGALRDLSSRRGLRRALAADLLGAAGVERAAAPLAALLSDADADVRRTAARALGMIGDPEAIPALLTSLEGRRPVPLNTVTMAILRIGRAGADALLTGFLKGGSRARAVCAELLGLQSMLGAAPALSEAVRNDEVLEVRIRAARALGRIGLPSSVETLAEVMRPSEPVPLRAVAARALGTIGGPRPVSMLREALDADEHIVRQNAAHALAALGAPGLAVLRDLAPRPGGYRTMYAREAISAAALATSGSARGNA